MERTERLEIRVSPKEREQIEAAAEASGLKVSEWIRHAATLPAARQFVPLKAKQESRTSLRPESRTYESPAHRHARLNQS
jgi:uncharacterized protein (DUF1778 family)